MVSASPYWDTELFASEEEWIRWAEERICEAHASFFGLRCLGALRAAGFFRDGPVVRTCGLRVPAAVPQPAAWGVRRLDMVERQDEWDLVRDGMDVRKAIFECKPCQERGVSAEEARKLEVGVSHGGGVQVWCPRCQACRGFVGAGEKLSPTVDTN
jgi:hypothetical protein